VVTGDDGEFTEVLRDVPVEAPDRDVGGALLLGVADDEVDARIADGVGRLLGPLVVVEPPDLTGVLDGVREFVVDVPELVRAEVADEDATIVGAELSSAAQAVLDLVGAGGHERRLAVHLADGGRTRQAVGVGVRHHDDVRALDALSDLPVLLLLADVVRDEKPFPGSSDLRSSGKPSSSMTQSSIPAGGPDAQRTRDWGRTVAAQVPRCHSPRPVPPP